MARFGAVFIGFPRVAIFDKMCLNPLTKFWQLGEPRTGICFFPRDVLQVLQADGAQQNVRHSPRRIPRQLFGQGRSGGGGTACAGRCWSSRTEAPFRAGMSA